MRTPLVRVLQQIQIKSKCYKSALLIFNSPPILLMTILLQVAGWMIIDVVVVELEDQIARAD